MAGVRITQDAPEVVTDGTPSGFITQALIESVASGSPALRVTQIVLEVIIPNQLQNLSGVIGGGFFGTGRPL